MIEPQKDLPLEMNADLAGYLAIHHHKANLAMLFANPDKKVRLLLSYIIYGARLNMTMFMTGFQYRMVIASARAKLKEVREQWQSGEINDERAKKLAFIYTDQAAIAHERLMELSRNADS